MWLAVLFVLGSCLPLAASEGCPEASEDTSSWVRLKPLGHCRDGESTCPYRITFPQLTIQLPKPFRELEKMARELQSLTQMVNQLKADCRECKERQRMQWNLRTADPGEDGERIQASRGTVNTKERQQDLQKREKVTQGNIQKTEEEQDRVLVNSGTKQVTLTHSWDRNSDPSHTGFHKHESTGGPKGSNHTQMDGKAKNMSKVREPHLLVTEETRKKIQYPRVIVTESSLPGNQDEVQTPQTSSYTADTRDRQYGEDDVSRWVDVVQDTTQVPPLKSAEEYDTTFTSSGTKQLNPAGIEDQGAGQERNPETSSSAHNNGQNSGGPTGSNPTHPKQVTTTGMENQRWTSSWDRNSDPSSTGHKDVNSEGPKGSNPPLPKQGTTTEMENQGWTISWDRNSNPSDIGHRDESNGGPNGSNPTHMDNKTKNMSKVSQPHQPLTEEKDKDLHSARVILTESSLPRNKHEGKQLNPAGTEKQSWHLVEEKNPKIESRTGHKVQTSGSPRPSNPAQMARRPDSMGKVTESKSFLSEERDKELQSLPKGKEKQPTKVSNDTINSRGGQQNIPPKRVQGTSQNTEDDTVLINSAPKQPSSGDMEKQKWTTNQERNPTSSRTGHRDETSDGLREANPTNIGRSSDSSSKVTESQSFLSEKGKKEPQSPRTKLSEPSLPRNQDVSSDTVITRGGEQDIPQTGVSGTSQKKKEATVPTSSGRKEISQTGIQKQRWSPGVQDRNFNIRKTGPRDETSWVLKEINPMHIEKTTESPSTVRESQDKEQGRHGENHKDYTSKVEQGQDPNGTLTAEGKIERIPETSVVPIVFEDDHIKTKQMNPPRLDKPIKRFPGFPRLINTNKTAVQGSSNIGNRLANLGDPTKRFSPIGNRTIKYISSGSGINPVRIRPKEKMPHKADNKEGTGSGDADMLHVVKNVPKIINSKNVLGERQPVTGTKAKNNSELNLNMTQSPKTVSAYQGEDMSDTRTRVKEPRPFMVDETSDSVVAKEDTAKMVQYALSENKDKKEKVNHSGDSLDEPHSKQSQSNQGPDDATLHVIPTDLQTQDNPSQSKHPFTPGRNAESGTRMDSVNPVGTVSKPEKIRSDQIQDMTDTTIDAAMHSSPINQPGTGLVDASSTYPQSLDSKDVLPNGKIKPDLNPTRQGSVEISKSLNPIKEETQKENVLKNNKATSLSSDPVKQTSTAKSREEKIPERSASRPEAPAVGSMVKGRPRAGNPIPIRNEKLIPHTRNSTKNQEGAKELSQPNQRMVKNVTRSIPNHRKQPERTASGRVIQAMNPKQRKPYILYTAPENRSSERVENTSGLNEHMVDKTNGRRTQGHPKIRPTSSSPSQEIITSTTNAMTQSVRPTVARHTIMDQVHLEKAKPAPTVEAINSLNTHQIQNTLQNAETKLFHVSEPGNPGGKRGLDPVTDGVREHSVETEMNQNIASLGSNNQSRPDSDQAVVEKTKGTDRQKGTNPLTDSSATSNQENNKKLLTGGSMHNSRGKVLTTVEKVSTERNELNYPTTAATLTIKTAIKDKQSQMTQTTAPVVTTPRFMTQVHAEKAKSTSGGKVSNTHVPHRLKNPSQEVEPKRLTETMYDSDSRNKEQNPRIRMSTERRVGGSAKETVSYPNSVENIPNTARDSNPFVMEKITNTSGPKWSTSSTESMPHTPTTTIASVLGKNRDTNGNSYPVAVDRVGDTKITKEGILIKPVTESPLTYNNLEDREGSENQLLSTCHGHCNPSPTPQPDINIQRSSENHRDKRPRDCSDLIKKNPSNGVYSVTPAGSNKSTFRVLCDMEVLGSGWTVIQHRFDGSISFNRTWNDYKRGFGNLTGEFWLGNDKIHWLTSTRAMVLRVELEDLDGVKEYAQYDRFRVANESQHYRLTIGGYSGTAGNAMQFSKKFNHDQKNFTTPDRDNDRYPSGNCGAYYSSGWWFDACMAANLNGKYYETKYKGVRNGIFWGTWHNISTEYYLTNDRQSFKTVRMMVRPRMAAGRDY